MIQNIFYGDVVRHNMSNTIIVDLPVTVSSNEITAHTPDLSSTTQLSKLDILLYNNINRFGEVLTSVVYISDRKELGDVDPIVYNPNKWLSNSDYEQGMTIAGGSARWKNVPLLIEDFKSIHNMSRGKTSKYISYDINTDDASLVGSNLHAFDGWFSLLSIAVGENTATTGVPSGTLRDSGGSIQYAITAVTDTIWTSINNITSDIGMIDFIRNEAASEIYYREDFFVLLKTNTLYNQLLSKEIANEWFTQVGAVRPKLRSMYAHAKNKVFTECQYLVNSINLTLVALIT